MKKMVLALGLMLVSGAAYADSMVCKSTNGTLTFSVETNSSGVSKVVAEGTIRNVSFKGGNPKYSSVKAMVASKDLHVYNSNDMYVQIDQDGFYTFGSDAYYIDRAMFGCKYID